jgi:hypothetical protein
MTIADELIAGAGRTDPSRPSSATTRPVNVRFAPICGLDCCVAMFRRFVPILLQKSKVAGLEIFRENTGRELIADSHTLNRVTEVACAFSMKR